MAFNGFYLAALKAISKINFDLQKNYKSARKFLEITHFNYKKPFYKSWDYIYFFENRKIPLRIYPPSNEYRKLSSLIGSGLPILIFLHGGGWVSGSVESYDKLCAELSINTEHLVISVEYRLAPEHPFPVGFDDCYQAAVGIFSNSYRLFGTKNSEITLMGDSAGGNLATAVSMRLRDEGKFFVKKQILLYPILNNDFTPNSQFKSIVENGDSFLLTARNLESYLNLYLGNPEDRCNPYVAPLLADDLSQMPKTLIFTAEFDPLRDEGMAFANKLRKFDISVTHYLAKGAMHGFFSGSPKNKIIRKTYNLMNQFLEQP